MADGNPINTSGGILATNDIKNNYKARTHKDVCKKLTRH